MIYSTKRDQYWSFWCQGWSNHHDQEFLGGNRAGEAGEANEVAEAAEVNEAAEVSRVLKITSEDFRVIQVLEFYDLMTNFDVLKKKIFWQNHENPIEFYQIFFRRLVRPAYVTFLKTGWWNSNGRTSGIHRCLYHNQKVVFRWPPRSLK